MGGRLRKRLLFSCLRVGRRLELGYELGQVRSSCGHAIINARRLRYREASFLPGLLSARLPDGGDSHQMVVVDCFNTIFRISRSYPAKKRPLLQGRKALALSYYLRKVSTCGLGSSTLPPVYGMKVRLLCTLTISTRAFVWL